MGLGRAPNVNNLGLETAGIRYDARSGILVDDHLRTSNRRVHAAGDVASKFKFTHTADAAARIVIENALFFGRAKVSRLTVPWTTYTDPELAHVGLSEKEAATKGIAVDTFVQELDSVDRAILDGETSGFVKVHVAPGNGQLRRSNDRGEPRRRSDFGSHRSDVGGMGLGALSRVIHPYPTQAEAIRK